MVSGRVLRAVVMKVGEVVGLRSQGLLMFVVKLVDARVPCRGWVLQIVAQRRRTRVKSQREDTWRRMVLVMLWISSDWRKWSLC